MPNFDTNKGPVNYRTNLTGLSVAGAVVTGGVVLGKVINNIKNEVAKVWIPYRHDLVSKIIYEQPGELQSRNIELTNVLARYSSQYVVILMRIPDCYAIALFYNSIIKSICF